MCSIAETRGAKYGSRVCDMCVGIKKIMEPEKYINIKIEPHLRWAQSNTSAVLKLETVYTTQFTLYSTQRPTNVH